MKPLYDDEYGILTLISGQPLSLSAQSLYPAQKKIDDEPSFGLRTLKQWYLFKNNVFKRYQAYGLKVPKVWCATESVLGFLISTLKGHGAEKRQRTYF